MRRYFKKIPLKRKIFSKDDIIQLAKILDDEFQEEDYELCFEISFTDESKISDNSIDVFKSDAIDRKRTKSVRMEYRSSRMSNSIEVTIYQSNNESTLNEISIQSSDEDWFNSITSKFMNVVDTTRAQSKLCQVNDYLWEGIFVFVIMAVSAALSSYMTATVLDVFELHNTLQMPIFLVIVALYCIIGFKIIFSNLRKTYPNIDFDFGPAHLQTSKNKDNIKWIVGSILFPIVLTIAANWLLN